MPIVPKKVISGYRRTKKKVISGYGRVKKKWLSRYKKNSRARNKRRQVSSRKRPGFLRGAVGAVAGEALKGTGHIGKYVSRSLSEDGMGGTGGVPVNNAGSGAVAGLGSWKDGPQGEPGVDPRRKKRKPLLTYKQFRRVTP